MADFNPGNALIRNGWEPVAGVPLRPSALDGYHEFVSESLTSDIGTIDRESITSASQRPPSLPSKIRAGGDINVELDAEAYVRYFANAQQKGKTPVDLSGAAIFQNVLAPSETDVTFDDTMQVEVWRDDDLGQIFPGAKVGALAFNASIESVFTCAISMQSVGTSYWGDSVIGVETSVAVADGDLPRLRNYPSYATWSLAAGTASEVHLKVISLDSPSAGDIELEAIIGAGAFPAANTFVTQFGVDSNGDAIWADVIDADTGTVMGDRAMPVQVHLPGATNYEVLDTFVVTRDRAIWTPTFPSLPVFNEIFITITIDAVDYCLQEFSLTLTRPIAPVFCIGGRFPKEIRERGQRVVEGSFTREYVSVDLRKRLERGEPFKLKVETFSGEIVAGGFEHRMLLVSPLCIAAGATASVSSSEEMNETIDWTGHPNAADAEGYVDDLTIEIDSTVEDFDV